MLRRVLKYLLYGIAWGWCWLVVTCLMFDLLGSESARDTVFDHFAPNVLASAIVGIGFGTSAIVYTFERLRRWQQTLIHFGVGMGIFFPVAFSFKWIPSASVPMVVSGVATAVLVFVSIWSCFYLYYRWETKKINERLKSQNTDSEMRGDRL